jgi:hypothetical protein
MCSFKITKQAFYLQVFERLRQRISRKKKQLSARTNGLWQCSFLRNTSVKSLLAMTQKAVLEHPPYCRTKLAPCDFNFPKPTFSLKYPIFNHMKAYTEMWQQYWMYLCRMVTYEVSGHGKQSRWNACNKVKRQTDYSKGVHVQIRLYTGLQHTGNQFGYLIIRPLRLGNWLACNLQKHEIRASDSVLRSNIMYCLRLKGRGWWHKIVYVNISRSCNFVPKLDSWKWSVTKHSSNNLQKIRLGWWGPKGLQRTGKVTGRRGPQACETSRLPHFSGQSAHRWRWE